MSAKKTPKKSRIDPRQMTFEQAVEELELIIERIEKGETELEESLKEYTRGAALIKRCREALNVAEQQMEQINAEQMSADDQTGH